MWFVRQIALDTDGTCSHTSYILQLICSMVYTAKIWVDCEHPSPPIFLSVVGCSPGSAEQRAACCVSRADVPDLPSRFVAVWQSFKMVMYIRWLPLLRKGMSWQLGITQVVLDEDDDIIDFCRDPPDAPLAECEGHGIYRRTRYLLYLFVIFPKVFIAFSLWWNGLYFLLTSTTDTDLLLNAVALLFVLASLPSPSLSSLHAFSGQGSWVKLHP